MNVFLLWHVHELDGEEDGKLIGVYSSLQAAESAHARATTRHGFRDLPSGFVIDCYKVDEDHWREGYVTVTHADTSRDWVARYVLAGGKSSRFGSDKARAELDDIALIVRVADVLRAEGREVVAVSDLPGKYANLGLETLADRRPGLGPLAGIEAALEDRLSRYGEGWIVVASCDLAGLKATWVDEIVGRLGEIEPDTGAVAFRQDFWQPFPGAYHTRLLPLVSERLDVGEGSFQQLLSDSRAGAFALPLPPDWPAIVQVNTPEELERFKE